MRIVFLIQFFRVYNMQRVPKLQQEDQAKWWDTLDRMQKLLRKAATTLYSQGQLDFDSMHNYLMSGIS